MAARYHPPMMEIDPEAPLRDQAARIAALQLRALTVAQEIAEAASDRPDAAAGLRAQAANAALRRAEARARLVPRDEAVAKLRDLRAAGLRIRDGLAAELGDAADRLGDADAFGAVAAEIAGVETAGLDLARLEIMLWIGGFAERAWTTAIAELEGIAAEGRPGACS
ncbi:MAG TPA: hypothetical protein VEH84_16165 [Alphaproteobacteria bacterium]|nr:hypothetical protein [Alphaproteobacteria bacterium]